MARPTKPAIVFGGFPGLFSDADLAAFAAVGTILDPEPLLSWTDERAADLLAGAEVVVGHWGCPRLDAAVLDAAPRLGLFAYAAGSLKTIVTADVFARGIRVTSGARANAEPVAEYTLATVLLCCKHALWAHGKGRRELARMGEPGSVGKTVGIVGASRVGRRVIELLAAFPHIDIALFDPYVPAAEALAMGARKCELLELCASSDIVSIHAPDIPETRHMIGAAELAAMRPGATVINTARGALVDHEALLAEVATGRIFAVLDVTDPEPLPADHPLRHQPNVLLTPHLAGSQGTELRRLAAGAAEEVRRWAAGEPAYDEVREADLARSA